MKKSMAAVVFAFMLTAFAIPAFCETNVVNEQKSNIQQEKLTQQEQDVKSLIEQEQINQEQIKKEVESKQVEQVEQVKQEKAALEQKEPAIEQEPVLKVKEEKTAKEKSEKGSIFNYSKDKSRTEIEIKVGRTVNAKPEIDRNEVKVDDVYTVGIEVMAYSNSFLGFGAGIYNVFDSDLKYKDGTPIEDFRTPSAGKYRIAFTNPYLTLKSKILQFDSDIIRNVYIYGQLGYGFMRIKNAYETEDGMYWGIGGGVEIWHFLLDVNYATNFGKIKMAPGENKIDVRQTTLILSVGYRFRL